MHEDVIVGKNVLIHPSAVIGSTGFRFRLNAKGHHEKIPYKGRVIIEDDVEIGANCVIEKGYEGDTIIGTGSKLDALCYIGHDCKIGRHNLIAAQCAFAGNVKTGDYVIIGGQCGFVGNIVIADLTFIAAGSGVTKSLKTGRYQGYPAMEQKKWMRHQAILRKLVKEYDADACGIYGANRSQCPSDNIERCDHCSCSCQRSK